MLTQLPTVKSRLAIPEADTTNDAILATAIKAVSARFDKENDRTLARTVAFPYEFDPASTEIIPPLYPIESVTRFELKTDETEGWVEQTGVKYIIRHSCVISLRSPLSTLNSQPSTARLLLTGGYVLPGKTYWPSGDIYKQFATQDLLASVSAVLRTHQRVTLC